MGNFQQRLLVVLSKEYTGIDSSNIARRYLKISLYAKIWGEMDQSLGIQLSRNTQDKLNG